MLTLPEKIVFVLAALATVYVAWRAVDRLSRIIGRGQGEVDWRLARQRLGVAVAKSVSLQPTFRTRFLASLFHGLVAWGFIYYLLVNAGDVLEGLIAGYEFLGEGALGNYYRLGADVLSVAVLVGMVALAVRRFVLRPDALTARQDILLHPKARTGIWQDSAIVGAFIIVHVGSRFLGETFHLAESGPDRWQPFASAVSALWAGWSPAAIELSQHLGFWLAIGSILLFIPYFPRSKHIHLFFGPLNFLLQPERRSFGQLDPLDFEDESVEQFGATHLEDLSWNQVLDAYACIMCYRCQEACPAYNTGKVLSPAAYEINKRYFVNQEADRLVAGEQTSERLVDFAISEEAVWACTACGACTDICPMGLDPMRDIMDIRRSLVLMENDFPDELQPAFRGMERTVNPWNVPPSDRLKWAEGMEVITIEDNPNPKILWWVGCAPATDPRAQKTARAFLRILDAADVDYAVLGEMEQCTGDSARRAGNEYLFYELANANVEILNEIDPPRIVTLCPHCLHTLGNEYPAFGGQYQVIHHTQFIVELIAQGQLKVDYEDAGKITFHDPCYLGRQNGILNEPRMLLEFATPMPAEMPRNRRKSFCCGAGGAQMWKEEEEGRERVSTARIDEALATGAETLSVGCPFCMIMLGDAAKEAEREIELRDLAEVIADRIVA